MLIKNNFKLSKLFITLFSVLFIRLFIKLFISDISTAQPATTAPPALFSDAGSAKPHPHEISPGFYIMRSRYARLNIRVLFDSKGHPKNSDQIPKLRFNLFPDADFIGTLYSELDQQDTWAGVMSPPGTFLLIARKEDIARASLSLSAGNRVFNVDCDKDFICVINEDDTSQYPPPG